MMAMRLRPHVALIIDTLGVYGRRILRGINQYLRSHSPWSIYLDPYRRLEGSPPHWLNHWHGDGIICRSITPGSVDRLRHLRIPIVNLNDSWTDLGFPLIRSDDRAVGRLAAEHLLERGFRRFAFCGFANSGWSQRRREGFADALRHKGELCSVYESPWGGNSRSYPGEKEYEAIGHWLASLPRPLGVLACNDERGLHVLDACQRIDAVVPDEVAVIGIDDDDLLCSLCSPPLSSVVPNPERIGYEAAALLDRLMAGDKPPRREFLVEPLGVTARQSTEALALDDPNLIAALRYIREHACEGLMVPEVLKQVPLSRTVLERQFRKYLGHSPQAEIRAVQLKRVKQLLVETDLSLQQIAKLAGYKHPEYMNVAFKRLTGQTPGHYRHLLKRGKTTASDPHLPRASFASRK
jgi:LacI family transcriptional regulator